MILPPLLTQELPLLGMVAHVEVLATTIAHVEVLATTIAHVKALAARRAVEFTLEVGSGQASDSEIVLKDLNNFEPSPALHGHII